jgi:tRNA-binding protein
MATIEDFDKLDIRAGEIVRAEVFPKAKIPAYKVWVDLGPDIGIRQSSARITECYQPEDLIGKQVLAVVNFPPRKVADFVSEILVLGLYAEEGVVLITPERKVKNGDKLG